jgi:hypothetical protein
MKLDDAGYWSRRAEREIALAEQCSGMEAAAHRARAAKYQDLAHQASRSARSQSLASL